MNTVSTSMPPPPTATHERHATSLSGTRRNLLAYEPALDGLRGLALLAIVLYHAELPWAPGAFLSVSTFFTLSGFLITVLLLAEEREARRVDLRAFWQRRLRRLLPASLATIAGIVLLSTVLADDSQLDSLRGDAFSALLYVSNWWFIASNASYGAIFESPSPLAHFWTLAIEEQYYLVFPPTLAAFLALTRRRGRGTVALLLAAAAVASALWSAYLFGREADFDRIYYGTDTRIGELLVGGLLAVGWLRYGDRFRGPAARRWISGIGIASLASMLLLWNRAHLDQEVWYQGGLTAYALLTCTVIVSAMNTGGPVRAVLSLRPLVWVGLVSYGAYLWHWPVLVWLDAHTGLGDAARFVVGLALTLGAAALSARFIERPIRRGRGVGPIPAARAAPLAVASVAVLVLLTTWLVSPTEPVDLAESVEALEELTASGPAVGDDLSEAERVDLRAAVEASTAPKISVFGDSTALATAFGLSDWAYRHAATLRPGGGWSMPGCGLVPEGGRIVDGQRTSAPPECQGWREGWLAEMEKQRPDIAYVQVGTWETFDTILEGEEALTLGEDPELDELVEARLDGAVELLLTDTPVVVLASSPDIDFGRRDGRSPEEPAPASDPARMARFREIIRSVAARHPDSVRIVDLAGYLEEHRADDARLRPDGVHFTAETTKEVAEWLGPELAAIHLEVTGSDTGRDALD